MIDSAEHAALTSKSRVVESPVQKDIMLPLSHPMARACARSLLLRLDAVPLMRRQVEDPEVAVVEEVSLIWGRELAAYLVIQ